MKIGTILALIKAAVELIKFLVGLREKHVEQTAETELGKAAGLDHDALVKEENKWTAP